MRIACATFILLLTATGMTGCAQGQSGGDAAPFFSAESWGGDAAAVQGSLGIEGRCAFVAGDRSAGTTKTFLAFSALGNAMVSDGALTFADVRFAAGSQVSFGGSDASDLEGIEPYGCGETGDAWFLVSHQPVVS